MRTRACGASKAPALLRAHQDDRSDRGDSGYRGDLKPDFEFDLELGRASR
jgi:hypothetical protein